jgi:hypothetical protein
MATVKKMKKAQEGTELRKGQYKRIGRIAERNPARAERVAERMNTRASRVDRGKEIANPPKMEYDPMDLMRKMDMDSQFKRALQRDDKREREKSKMKKGGVVKKKMEMGGSLKTPTADQKGLKKLPTAVRNKMGFKKNGGTMSKKK